jgi:hypothetical protein
MNIVQQFIFQSNMMTIVIVLMTVDLLHRVTCQGICLLKIGALSRIISEGVFRGGV